jgi:hypothetical protein
MSQASFARGKVESALRRLLQVSYILMADMHRDVNDVQKKFVDLAGAVPEGSQ